NADGMLNLGNMYRDGQGVPQDLTRARELFEQAVHADHPGAMVNLGAYTSMVKVYHKTWRAPENCLSKRSKLIIRMPC
ncbi:tetratricopeptide repeat protein, partial [Aeromonas hydrophila]|uniref:tetratricopeptide repeat protein n=1 Tax=Aeromonas hydrophila TaxID=644 RepID=UPI000ADCCC84